MANRPTTVRFSEQDFKAIDFLKRTNQGKFGEASTSQILSYAIQLVLFEQIKDDVVNESGLSWIFKYPSFCKEEIESLITNNELKSKLTQNNVFNTHGTQIESAEEMQDPFGLLKRIAEDETKF